MHLGDILSRQSVLLDETASSKKRVLEQAAHLLANEPGTPESEAIFERLLERERLGSTGLAGGVALPHARMPGVTRAHGAFIRLNEATDFDALDDQPTDLVLALLVPEEATDEHLQLLAGLAKLFSNVEFRERLRHADVDQIHDLLTRSAEHDAA